MMMVTGEGLSLGAAPLALAACRHGSGCWRPGCSFSHAGCDARAARLRELAAYWALQAGSAVLALGSFSTSSACSFKNFMDDCTKRWL